MDHKSADLRIVGFELNAGNLTWTHRRVFLFNYTHGICVFIVFFVLLFCHLPQCGNDHDYENDDDQRHNDQNLYKLFHLLSTTSNPL